MRGVAAVGALMILAVVVWGWPAAVSVGAQTVSASEDLPIVDTHIHYNRDVWGLYSVDDALALLDHAGVRTAFVSSTPDDGTLMLYARAPDRIVPILRPYRTPADQFNWTHDASILAYVAERLNADAGSTYRGLGEFHLLSGQVGNDAAVGLITMAANRGLVLHAHADAGALEELLRVRADVSVIWAHAGMSAQPATVRRIFETYPNVWVELALRTDVAPGGRLDPDWAALFEADPDRFTIGTDTWSPSQWTRVPAAMADVRGWLRQLRPDLATAIASGNAARLLGLSGR
jgi:hypothetical protein